MSLLKELPELVDAGILSEEKADEIRAYYRGQKGKGWNRLPILFGILGALLAGLGIILIVAENWNELSRSLRSVFAFLPLLLGQALTLFVLLKRPDARVWREGVAVLLFFAVGACISMISQTYQIQGDTASFLFTWSLLTFPILYVLRSPTASLLYLAAITYYTLESAYGFHASAMTDLSYPLFLLLALPFLYKLYKERPNSNFTAFHNWLLPFSLAFGLGTLWHEHEEMIVPAYFGLFACFLSFGLLDLHKGTKGWKNGFLAFGRIASLLLLLPMSFKDYWERLQQKDIGLEGMFQYQEGILSLVLMLPAIWILLDRWQRRGFQELDPIQFVAPVFFLLFLLGFYTEASVFFVNLLVVLIGGVKIYRGAKDGALGTMNFGAVILFVWMLARFFATELSYVTKGVIFIVAGLLIFALNLWMFNRKRSSDG